MDTVHSQMVGFSSIRVMIIVSVRIVVKFSFSGANLQECQLLYRYLTDSPACIKNHLFPSHKACDRGQVVI